MVQQLCQIGVLGLATMGANLARNIARNGYRVAVYNRHAERTDRLVEQHGHEGEFVPAQDLNTFVAAIERPRAIVLMVEAGAAVEAVVAQLSPLLDPGDILVDAGNSLFSDTERRVGEAAVKGLRFVGMGMSGGEKGALHGPSLMPGGDADAYRHLEPLLTAIAAQVDGEACCAFMGPGGAGHYVKMVHNGIEYADMQAIAEVYDLLRTSYALGADEIANVFERWRDSELSSYLVDITAGVFRRRDDDSGDALIDRVVDEAEQKGTGRWTASDALALGVVGTSIAQAVGVRVLSAGRDLRLRAASLLSRPVREERHFDAATEADLRDALLAARLVAFSQGFEQLAAASLERGWHLDLGAIARIWRGGCIIRARVLDHILDVRLETAHGDPLLLEPWFLATLRAAEPGWRRAAGIAIADGLAAPVLTSALAYHDGLRARRSPANLIQALRDEFGAHGYRVDGDGSRHTDWSATGTQPK